MPSTRKLMAHLLLHSPLPVRSVLKIPWIGAFVHRLSHRLIPSDEKVWACVQAGAGKGLWLELNPRTGHHYIRGDVEPAVQEILIDRLQPGMILYDLGANIGFFTLLAAKLVGESGKVFSFEPDFENASRLRRNIQRNGFKNVIVVEAGVWSATQKLAFVRADSASPDHGIGKFTSAPDGMIGRLTPCVSLDDFALESPAPDAIKCDVEGAETEVFLGAKKILQAKHPWIVCEMHSPANERTAREILGRLNYAFKTIDDTHLLASISPDSNRGSGLVNQNGELGRPVTR